MDLIEGIKTPRRRARNDKQRGRLWEMDLIEGIKTQCRQCPVTARLFGELWEMDLIEGIKTCVLHFAILFNLSFVMRNGPDRRD